ncbi:serine hydrolase [Runella sp. SP2]|uniref:serine hydrolase domain-containing protein n=1 Tax=Runella sp. SP2 TaxID=2268026 RepID=UPI000F079E2B|nr:serine hydrolase domain-containing protein [Runella sp. SP2]AYQ33708.1 class A beta-lactamase-related serine hydrolase [Runella sp. SP2]
MKYLLNSLFFLSFSVFAQNYDAVLKKYDTFNGVVLVANQGKIEYLKGAGLANRQEGIRMTPQTKFRICSITKTFTAVLVLQLMEEGKLKLTDKLSKFLPDYQGEAKEKVTIHQLLTYSSGMENLDQNNEAMYALKYPLDSIVRKYCSGKLVSEPGTQFSYKNADYILLGKIIEAVTKKPFEQVLQEKILDKIGVQNSGLLSNAKIVKGLANSYLYDTLRREYANDDPYWIENFYASGAMFSTVEDLLTFDQAIFKHQILTKPTVELMLKSYPELWYVAYGFWVSENTFAGKKIQCADRQGSISGSNMSWLHLINENRTFIVFSNTDATKLNDLRAELVETSLAK